MKSVYQSGFAPLNLAIAEYHKPTVFKEQIDFLDASDLYWMLTWNDSCPTWLSWIEIYMVNIQ